MTEVVLTVPSYFNDQQKQAMRDSATIAGLNVNRLIQTQSVTTAMTAYRDKTGDRKVMSLDLGGGTFDCTVLEISD